MARVFSAIDIEENQLLEELEQVRDKLDLGFNPVPREKMHITFEFFADINENEIEQLKEAMDEIDSESFKARIKGIGAFPSNDYIRVVWAGTENGKFRELHEQLSDHNVESDNDHDFKPHITLMRVENLSREEKKKLQRMLKEFEDHDFGEIEVGRIKLFESRMGSKGSEYEELYVKEL